ncbi:MAG: MBOAT family protein [Leptolyngbya sp. SIO4C1]|nr:MBOAT family protein [Leptolyngbya sp. SIO4C1]
MLFNSYLFIFVFLPTTLAIFFGLSRLRLTRLAIAYLVISSLIFYAYWNPAYLPLLLGSVVVNYGVGRRLSWLRSRGFRPKPWLVLGIAFNLGLIAYFKYADFFISTLPVSTASSLRASLQTVNIALPLAISFFTFQQIAYLVDAYRGITKPYSFLDYCLFVCFFPQLIAGPIVHHKDVLHQFHRIKTFCFSQRNMALGLAMFTLGLAKKVLIADNLSPWVATVFSQAEAVTFIEAWVGALSYTFQLYFDFSGYSDMAIGLALMFNIRLPLNFNSPYKARSISDFWRRWHITLSNFLRDYLYIPLGGSRRGEPRRYANLIMTMLLGGLWHGAGWTFVLWGGLHGVYLSLNHAWRRWGIALPALLSWGITFLAVVASWVLFRASSLADAIALLQTMSGLNGIVLPGEAQGKLGFLTQYGIQLRSWQALSYLPVLNGSKLISLGALAALTLGVVWLPNTHEIVQRLRPRWWWAAGIGAAAAVSLLSLNRVSEFLYFQF